MAPGSAFSPLEKDDYYSNNIDQLICVFGRPCYPIT